MFPAFIMAWHQRHRKSFNPPRKAASELHERIERCISSHYPKCPPKVSYDCDFDLALAEAYERFADQLDLEGWAS